MKFRYILLSLLLLALCRPAMAQKKRDLRQDKTQQQSTEVLPTWESINRRGYPAWFGDAKLGIFIHWGLYSVPAWASTEGYAEWFYRGLMTGQEDRFEALEPFLSPMGVHAQDSSISTFDKYAYLTHYWHGELFDPDEWAQLFKDAGAQYILLVTKHHDGYCLWDSPQSPRWNSVSSGPHRDIVKDMADAVRRKGIRFGAYYSLPEWTNPRHTWMESPNDSIADYVENHMIPQLKDMVTRYRPEVLFTDGEWFNNAEQWHARELIAWYYNLIGPDAICNDRWGNGQQHGFRTPEYSAGITMTDRPWAECRGLGRSFAFNRNEPLDNYVTSDELIQHFAKLVAAGGGMTLNVGPYADGSIPLLQQERLRDLGRWLKVNGEGIYGTRPWTRFYDTKQVSVSRRDETIDFDWKRNSPDRTIAYDNFSAIWSGTVVPTHSADYTFRLAADDSASFSIQDLDDASSRNIFLISTKDTQQIHIPLVAGHRYLIFVNYSERDLEATVSLTWSRHGMKEEPVRTISGWEATFACEQPYVCYTRKGNDLYAIMLGWEDNPTLPWSDAINPQMEISLLGCSKNIPWNYDPAKERITINTDNLTYSDISNSRAAWIFRLKDAAK